MDTIYLDHNSTTPIDPVVAKAMADCYAQGYVNPASAHRPGQLARRKLEELRQEMISILGGETGGRAADQLILTSGGTESNNLAIHGLSGQPPGRVLISSVEHPSVIGAAENLARQGFQVHKIPVDKHGVCQPNQLANLLGDHRGPVSLVSVMLVNNETGVMQPISEIAEICRENGILMHVDAVQAVAKISVNFRELGVDAMSFTAHKFHGPRGIGGLLLRSGIELKPILFGGFQQLAMRPGTEDVALAAGMHRALKLFDVSLSQRHQHLEMMRDSLQNAIIQRFPDTIVNGGQVKRAPHTLNISFPGVNRQAFLMAADVAGLAISTGSACASGSSEPSHVLVAMGAQKNVVEGSIRISVGASTTMSQVEKATSRIIKIASDLRQKK